MDFTLRPLTETDCPFVAELLTDYWGSVEMALRGRLVNVGVLPGFFAVLPDGECVGLITYQVEGDTTEIMSLNSFVETRGVGSALIQAVKGVAQEQGCRRLCLITTNDNIDALRFYQRRGFHFAAIFPNSIEASRRLKPEIPLVGFHGIPLRDEIELMMNLPSGT